MIIFIFEIIFFIEICFILCNFFKYFNRLNFNCECVLKFVWFFFVGYILIIFVVRIKKYCFNFVLVLIIVIGVLFLGLFGCKVLRFLVFKFKILYFIVLKLLIKLIWDIFNLFFISLVFII